MGKCAFCDARKGKRKCQIKQGAFVCPVCCGDARQPEGCGGCVFYKPPTRNYKHLPRYSGGDMQASARLTKVAFPVEAALCELDRRAGFALTDMDAVDVLALLLDLFCFGDSPDVHAERLDRLRCESVLNVVREDLAKVDREVLHKVLATLWYYANRRGDEGRQGASRHHLNFLQDYAGAGMKNRWEEGAGVDQLESP